MISGNCIASLSREACIMLFYFVPAEWILHKTLLPYHGCHCSRHEVRIIFGTITYKMAEAELPSL